MINYEVANKRLIDNNIEAITKAQVAYSTAQEKQLNFFKIHNSIELHKLNACFDKLKLEATVNHFHQKGETIEDFRTKGFKIAIHAVPLPGSGVKPVVHAGYKKSGASVNEKVRAERTERLQTKIMELTGYQCHINEFSMEIKDKNDPCRILIELHIPHPDVKTV